MATAEKLAKMTIEFDDRNLYKAVKLAAVEEDRTLRQIVFEALKDWLRKRENAEDLAAMAQADATGGKPMDWDQFKTTLDLPAEEEAVERAR